MRATSRLSNSRGPPAGALLVGFAALAAVVYYQRETTSEKPPPVELPVPPASIAPRYPVPATPPEPEEPVMPLPALDESDEAILGAQAIQPAGMGSSAFVAYLSLLCNTAYTGTQFALFTSLMAFGRTWLSAVSGWVADQTDWVTFFVISTPVALPGLLLLVWMMKRLPMQAQMGHVAAASQANKTPLSGGAG